MPADTLRTSFGVNTHVTWRATPYAATTACQAAVVELIARLGASWWRERADVADPLQVSAARALANGGCGQLAMIGQPGDSDESLRHTVASLRTAYGGDLRAVVRAVSGPNEPNDLGWSPAQVASQQRAIYAAVRADSAYGDMPVVAPALKGQVAELTPDLTALGASGIAQWCDYGDIHYYPPGTPPGFELGPRVEAAARAFAGKPIFCSETGYVDALDLQDGPSIPPDVVGLYAPRMLLEMVRRGVTASFVYQLLNESNRPDGDRLAHFGLVDSPGNDPQAWTPKPAFDSLSRLIALTRDEGPAFSPRGLSMRIDGDVRFLLLGRRDGSHVLMLWRDASAYDPVARFVTPVAPITATVVLDRVANVTATGVSSGLSTQRRGVTATTVDVAAEAVALTIR